MEDFKNFIEKSIKDSGKSERKIYLSMGKTQKAFMDIKKNGDMKISDYLKFCECVGIHPSGFFVKSEIEENKEISNLREKLIIAYEILLKNNIEVGSSLELKK